MAGVHRVLLYKASRAQAAICPHAVVSHRLRSWSSSISSFFLPFEPSKPARGFSLHHLRATFSPMFVGVVRRGRVDLHPEVQELLLERGSLGERRRYLETVILEKDLHG